jgi:ribosome-binding factor A
MINRLERIGIQIRNEVSSILQFEIDDPWVFDVTITRAEVSKDLRYAKIFYIAHTEEKIKKIIKESLTKYSKFIRGELSKRISMKYSPQIKFYVDEIEEYVETMDDIFNKIREEKPPSEEEKGSENDF